MLYQLSYRPLLGTRESIKFRRRAQGRAPGYHPPQVRIPPRTLAAVRLACATAVAAAVGLAACSKDATVPIKIQLPDYDNFPAEDHRAEINSFVLSIWKGTPGLCHPLGASDPMKLVTARVYPADARSFSAENLRGGRDQFVVLEGCRQLPEDLEADPSRCDAVYRGSSVPGDYLAPGQTEPTGRKYDVIRLFFGRVGVFNPLQSVLSEGNAFGGALDLGNGKFAFAGGIGEGGTLPQYVYVFDRDDLQFNLLPDRLLLTPRVFPAMARRPGGGAVLFGGYASVTDTQALTPSEELDRDGTPMEGANLNVAPRAFASAVPIAGDRVLLTGGVNDRDFLDPEPDSFEWDESGVDPFQPGSARVHHAGVPLPDGRALFTGGISKVAALGFVEVSANADVVESASSNDKVSGMLPRWGHTATVLPDGRVLLAGGAAALPALTGDTAGLAVATVTSADLFDFVANAFATERPAVLKTGRANHAAAALGNGDVVLAGGTRCAGAYPGFVDFTTAACEGGPIVPLRSTEIWWNDRNQFVDGPDLLYARTGHAAFHLGDGTLLVAGGIGATGQNILVAEIYVPTWRCSATTSTAFP